MKIIKYKTNEAVDFSEELDKIWWDHLSDDPTYEVSMVNTDVLTNPISRNAYSYQIKDDERIYYSIITNAKFKQNLHSFYEDNILKQKVYDFQVIDKHTYSVKYYDYLNDNSWDTVQYILAQIEEFKQYPPTHTLTRNVLDEFVNRSFSYFDSPEFIRDFYENNIDELLSLQTFNQGNSHLSRIQHNNEILFFDYFSVYERPFYQSYLLDIGSLLVSYLNTVSSPIDTINVIKYLANHKHSGIIAFWMSLQEECSDKIKKTIKGYIK